MDCLAKRSLWPLIAAALALAPSARATEVTAARNLSFTVQDHAPDIAEAKAITAGTTVLKDLVATWMTSVGHQRRVERFFSDMFAAGESLRFVRRDYRLLKGSHGGYYLQAKGTCTAGELVSADAWWLEPGETANFCPTVIGTNYTYASSGQTKRCTRPGSNGIGNANCGCGPQQIFCLPEEQHAALLTQAQREFGKRGAHIYESDGSWTDLVGGDTFYGSRLLYWLYLVNNFFVVNGGTPSIADFTALAALPLTGGGESAYPSGPIRSGLATTPAFLVKNNTFRSRVAGLTRALLCQEVDGTLNTDNTSTFFNPNLTAADLAHGEKASCSSCHYPMDNMGTMLFGWSDMGFFSGKASQIGHAFGQTGTGPRVLMQGFVDDAPTFYTCMAKRAWEDFSGRDWDDLPAAIQTSFTTLAKAGPRALVQGVLTSDTLAAAADPALATSTTTSSTTRTLTFAADVGPIVAAQCSGSGCHSSGSFNSVFVANEASFVASKASVADRISRTASGKMPPVGSGKQLTDAEKTTITDFFSAK